MNIWIQQKKITRNWIVNHVSLLITSSDTTKLCSINLLWKELTGRWNEHTCLSSSYQSPYHHRLYKHCRQDERQPPQSGWPVSIYTSTWLIQLNSFMAFPVVWFPDVYKLNTMNKGRVQSSFFLNKSLFDKNVYDIPWFVFVLFMVLCRFF